MNTALLSSIVNSDTLPSMPAVALKVVELCREDDVDIQDVADAIAGDPALTARMLKAANSSMFGMSKKVGTLQQAMVVLGLRTVKVMALGFSLTDTLKGESKSGFDYPSYWRRSLTTAVAARNIADQYGGVRKDEVFIGGLLCDIGMIAAERHPDGIYSPVIERHRAESGHIHEIESAVLGLTHADISAMMLANWSMPEPLCHAVKAHHGEGLDELDSRSKPLACILLGASELAGLFSGDLDPSRTESVIEGVVARTGVSREFLDGVMDGLNQNVREAAEMFSVNLGEEISPDQLRQSAMTQLVNLSMNAEQDRVSAEQRVDQAETQMKSLRHRAETDKLTGIANRQAFDDHLDATIRDATDSKRDIGLIIMDIDHFKNLNDTHGHQAGDEALRRVGACLDEISENSQFVARYGGEEFAFVVAQASARELREFAEQVRESISRIRFDHNGTPLKFTASFGAAHVSFGEESVDSEELIMRADECLYAAKEDGRNRVEITF
ncbi:MAG: GGDEF domain-containing protein [Planctomycetes bacterium]|nr:GGDEF domain-containing protein [Planctomycetota bacterium]